MKKYAAGPVSEAVNTLGKFLSGKRLLPLFLAGSGLVILNEFASAISDILKTRYKTINLPLWEAKGKAQLYSNYDDMVRFNRAREMLYSATYDKPLDIAFDKLNKGVDLIGEKIKDISTDYKVRKNFEDLKSNPIVKALGTQKAMSLYNQVASLSPNIVSKAPDVALSILARSTVEDTPLNADVVYKLVKSQQSLGE